MTRNHFQVNKRPRAHRGFTLIELLVAAAVGLLLIAGVGRLFLANNDGYRVMNGMARLQENARYALDFLKGELAQAGFPRGAFLSGLTAATVDGGGSASDTIGVTYQAAQDCAGTATAGTAVNVITRAGPNPAGLFALTCNNVEVVEGIDNLQVLYGMDLDGDGAANQYVSATGVGGAWPSVVTVRLAVLVNSVDEIRTAADATQFRLLDAPPLAAYPDFRRRQVFTSTVLLRN